MTGISSVAALTTDVGILGVGLKAEQQSSVTNTVCVLNTEQQDFYREVKHVITNAT